MQDLLLILLLVLAAAAYYILHEPEDEDTSTNNSQNSASADGQGTAEIEPEVSPEPVVQPEIIPVLDVDGKELNPGNVIQSNLLLPQGATVADHGGIQYTGDQLDAAINVLKDRQEKGEVKSVNNVTADNCKSPPCPPPHCTISNSIMEKLKKHPQWGSSFDNYTGPFKCSSLDGTGTRPNCQPNTSTFCTAQGLANAQSPLCSDSSGTTNPAVLCYCPPLKCSPKTCNGTTRIDSPKGACYSKTSEADCNADSACKWS